METLIITKQEFEEASLKQRRKWLSLAYEFKELQTAIRNIDTLVNKNPSYKDSWKLIKSYIDDEDVVQVFLEK